MDVPNLGGKPGVRDHSFEPMGSVACSHTANAASQADEIRQHFRSSISHVFRWVSIDFW